MGETTSPFAARWLPRPEMSLWMAPVTLPKRSLWMILTL